jgi:tetratricopeptide (TPR) repeat protein
MRLTHTEIVLTGPRSIFLFLAIAVCANPTFLRAQAAKSTTVTETPTATAERGITLATQGHCEQALPVLKKIVPKIQNDKDLLHDVVMSRAQCGMALDQRDAVDESLIVLRREFPNDSKVLLVTTRYYSELANRTAQELLQKSPSSPEAMTLVAEAFQAQGKWDDAAAQYRKILQQNPNQPGIHYQLGRILLSKPLDPKITEEATKEFEAELKINHLPAAEFMLGDLAWRNQKADEAIEHFTRAIQYDASLSEAYLGLGIALNAAGKHTDAIPPLKKYTEMEPSDPGGFYQLAIAYARVGNKQEADRLMAVQADLEKNRTRMQPTPPALSQPH